MASVGPGLHLHVSATNALITVLYVVVFFGAMRLWAVAHPGNRFAQAWLFLF